MIPMAIQPINAGKQPGTTPVLASTGAGIQAGGRAPTGAFADILATSIGGLAQESDTDSSPEQTETAQQQPERGATTVPEASVAPAPVLPAGFKLPAAPRNTFSGPASPAAAPQDQSPSTAEPTVVVDDTDAVPATSLGSIEGLSAVVEEGETSTSPGMSAAPEQAATAQKSTTPVKGAAGSVPAAKVEPPGAAVPADASAQTTDRPTSTAPAQPAPGQPTQLVQQVPAAPVTSQTGTLATPASPAPAAPTEPRAATANTTTGPPPSASTVATAPAAPTPPAAGTAPPPPSPAQPPMVRAWTVQQLNTPVARLAGQVGTMPSGQAQTIVRISPETLGPVTIEATVRDGVVRLEVTAATEAGRENLRMVMGELKRELAAQQPNATLEMGAGKDGAKERDMAGADPRQDGRAGAGRDKDTAGGPPRPGQAPPAPQETNREHPEGSPGAGLDVYA